MRAFDSTGTEYQVLNSGDLYTIRKNDIFQGREYVDMKSELFTANAGEEGYYVIADVGKCGSRLVRFRKREDNERVFKQNLMPVLGVKNSKGSFLIIAEGYRYEMSVAFGIKNSVYYMYPRFELRGEVPYEDISVRILRLEDDSDYSDMAVKYREYKLERKDCAPIKERIKSCPELAYAVKAPEIRIRMGWKPAPAKIREQTLENEPEMKVACTFDRVRELIDELKRQGVERAQICLVGWNKSGHDGRWPQAFPVEDKLGGEERLRHLIKYARENGFQIVCHTNSTDSYHIADTFSPDIVVKKANGDLAANPPWSGGTMYDLCPVKAVEYAERDLPRIRDLGFRGLHYIDVMSVVPLRWCYDSNHPLNSSQTMDCYNGIMKLCHELFGGFSSEGVFDFCAKYLDYGLYVAFPKIEDDMLDEEIPLWEIAYHGIILYNTSTDTVNYPIKSREQRLKLYETGGRPAFYLYSKFMEGGRADDWLGKEDLSCTTDEDMKYSVAKIAEACREYHKFAELQTEYILKHRRIGDEVYEISYTNGSRMTVDYRTFDIKLTNDKLSQ